jgi:hypothetical protein
MQFDFHHTITYLVGRLAGFSHPDALVIGRSAQMVDESINGGLLQFRDGRTYRQTASSHLKVPGALEDLAGFKDNFSNVLNSESWIPFHFVPGNQGKEAGQGQDAAMVRRLVCTPDSPLAARMNRACIASRDRANGLHRLGITAHAYVDTWAHQGFVGLETPFNGIQGLVHNRWTLEGLRQAVESRCAQLLNIGHAGVLTLPDLPYLSWGYTDRDGNVVQRDNFELFLQAAERLMAFFLHHRGEDGGRPMDPRDREVLRDGLVHLQDPGSWARHERWVDRAAAGVFTFGTMTEAEQRELRYGYVSEGQGSWRHQALGALKSRDEEGQVFDWTPVFETSDWKRFQDALREHRAELLERILPEFALDPGVV